MGRLKNRLMAKLLTKHPSLVDRFLEKADTLVAGINLAGMPWTPMKKPLSESRVALVTTAGVHLGTQKPFDMKDPDGDPSFREISSGARREDLTITHDYYDHSDADKDINIVFPVDRLKELSASGLIGEVGPRFFGLMGHISGRHVKTLYDDTAREIARRLKEDLVDAVVLTPG
jgi:D-proline reductase (dithiol) PrdB